MLSSSALAMSILFYMVSSGYVNPVIFAQLCSVYVNPVIFAQLSSGYVNPFEIWSAVISTVLTLSLQRSTFDVRFWRQMSITALNG